MNVERHIVQLRVIRKRSGQRVVAELNDGETIEVDPEVVVRHSLKTGAPVNEEMIEQLEQEDELLRARRRLTGYLALRVKSVADARLYLEKGGFSEAAVAAAIEDATERDLLDDRRFAERYVRSRLKTTTLGPLRLLAELSSHGIEPSLAEEVVRPQFNRDWQLRVAQTLARKRTRNTRSESEEDEVKSLYHWLKLRGFEDDIARAVAECAT